MKILAIDTTTHACSAALYVDGDIKDQYRLAPREHSKIILPMMENLLNAAGLSLPQLDALAFTQGPGSFTGVRIGTGVIQGVALGADLPVVPVSTLAAIAQGMYQEFKTEYVLSALDARMDEVYWGAYQLGQADIMELSGDECVIKPDQVNLPTEKSGWTGAGSGWDAYNEIMMQRLDGYVEGWEKEIHPHARGVATLAAVYYGKGKAVQPEKALPVYLRDEVAWKKS